MTRGDDGCALTPHRLRYAVLGAGAAGLTLALRLARAGQDVTVLEREPMPGGLAAGFRVGDAWLEKFYHHLFQSDRAILSLIEELGLGGQMHWGTPETRVLWQGEMHRLDSALTLLRFPALPLPDRLRMGAALAYLKASRNPARLEGQMAAAWISTWMGRRAASVVWEPLLGAKFGTRADQIAAPWFWARVHDRTRALGYLRGGFQQLYDRLADELRAAGGRLHCETAVTGICRAPEGGLRVETDAACTRYDRVVSCLPTRVTCRLAPELPEAYRRRYDWGEAFGAHCLVLALDRPLSGGYWLNVNDAGYPFMVVVEHTNFLPAADYGGRHLLYLGNYRPMDDPLLQQDAETVFAAFAPHLRRINPAFDPTWVRERWLFSAPYAQPVVTRDYRAHIPPFATPLPGLYTANMFQIYPHDRGQNYSVALAERLARHLLATPTR